MSAVCAVVGFVVNVKHKMTHNTVSAHARHGIMGLCEIVVGANPKVLWWDLKDGRIFGLEKVLP